MKKNLLTLVKLACRYTLYGIFLQFLLVNIVLAQSRTITGRVASEEGETLPGVNVIEKGTTNGTVTDAEGKYSISVAEGAILAITAVGFTTTEIEVGGRSIIDVELAPDIRQLEEVVVIGYGTQKKETLTGAVVDVQGDKLKESPSISLTNSLAGRLPGVIALNRTGEPGADFSNLLIRGRSTLGTLNQNGSAMAAAAPLIVIDGVAGRAGFNDIDPRDVESISVLKDASAAIYGAQAANGVILITTKRGKTGKPTINYTFNQGFNNFTRLPKFASSADLAIFENEQLAWENSPPKWTQEEIQKFRDGSDPVNYPNTDWQKVSLQDFNTQSRHSISLRGGTDVVKYYVAGNRSNQGNMFKNGSGNYNTIGGRSNIDAQINKNLKVTVDLSMLETNNNRPGNSYFNNIADMYRAAPYHTAIYPNGLPGDSYGQGKNPVVGATAATGYNNTKTNLYQTRLAYDLIIPYVKGLAIDGFVAYDKTQAHNKLFQKPFTVYTYDKATDTYNPKIGGNNTLARLTEKYDFLSNVTVNTKLRFERTFESHRLNSFVAIEQTKINTNFFSGQRINFPTPVVEQLSAGDALNQVTQGGATEFTRRNYFGRFSYGFKEKYLLDFNARYDGSSNFPKGKRWGFFPGVSVGWVLSEEEFVKTSATVDFLKIRGSWGLMGNDAIAPFQYLASYGFTTGAFLGADRKQVPGITQGVQPNPNVTWEVVRTVNIGLDAELWEGLLGVTLDVFKTRRSNILTLRDASVPIYTGLRLPVENLGIVENKGFEIALRHTRQMGSFNYSIQPNMAFARNKIIDIDEPANIPEWQKREGRAIGLDRINNDLYYIPLGIYRTQEQIDNSPHPAGTRINDLQYKDINDDGVINALDRHRTNKTSVPEITYGMHLSFGFKNLDLGILLQGQARAWTFYSTPQGLGFGSVLQETFDNRPTPDNPNSKYPNITWDQSLVSGWTSEFWVADLSFLRLKTVELGYTFPSHLSGKIGMQGLRMYVNGFNIFSIDKVKWYDPEGAEDVRGRFYPQTRIFNCGVNVTF